MKEKKLKELHLQENELNKQIRAIDKRFRIIGDEKVRLQFQKNKVSKKISHNMKLRNIIIDEMNKLKR